MLRDPNLFALAKEAIVLDARLKRGQRHLDRLRRAIRTELEKRKVRAVEGEDVRITYVAPKPVEYHAEELRRRLSDQQWEAVTRRTLDQDKLAWAVQEGIVPLQTVQECTGTKAVEPYVKLTGMMEAPMLLPINTT